MSIAVRYFRAFLGAHWHEQLGRIPPAVRRRHARLHRLTDDEMVAVRAYTTHNHAINYTFLNTGLRGGPRTAEVKAYALVLDRALSKLPRHFGLVRRRVELPQDERNKLTAGNQVRFEGFTSCTTGSVERFQGNDDMVIYSVSGRDIADLSAYPHEHEVLFRRRLLVEVDFVKADPVTGGLYLDAIEV